MGASLFQSGILMLVGEIVIMIPVIASGLQLIVFVSIVSNAGACWCLVVALVYMRRGIVALIPVTRAGCAMVSMVVIAGVDFSHQHRMWLMPASGRAPHQAATPSTPIIQAA